MGRRVPKASRRRRSPPIRRRRRRHRARRRADCRSTASPIERPADVLEYQHRAHAGTRLSYTLVRLGTQQALDIALAPAPRSSSMYFVLAAVGLFTLLVGASVRLRRPRRSGDAALLLAVRRVLRRVHLLVQRTVRSAGLDLLLGRRGRDGAAAAAAARFHARISRSGRPIAVGLVAVRPARLHSSDGARRRARDRCHARGRRWAGVLPRDRRARPGRPHLPVLVRHRRARSADAGVRQITSKPASGSCGGSRGARPLASARSRCSTRCPGRSAWIRR